jgi:hypothetical protein
MRQKTSHSYFVVMIDYGQRGCEAIVDPEMTYRNLVDRVRSGEYKNVLFIHHIQMDQTPDDVTSAVFYDAGVMEVA